MKKKNELQSTIINNESDVCRIKSLYVILFDLQILSKLTKKNIAKNISSIEIIRIRLKKQSFTK